MTYARILLALLVVACTATPVRAQTSGSGITTDSFVGGVSTFFFSDESHQDDRVLPGGKTTLAFVNMQYNMPDYFSGFGLVYQLDKYGTAQTGTHYGLKYEFYDEYYLEAVYSQVTQAFKDRSVAKQEGTETVFGFGRRVPILDGLLYFDLSLKRRSAVYTTEDGNDLAHPVSRTELLPFLGLGTIL